MKKNIGSAINNLAMGIAIGIAVGVAIGAGLSQKNKKGNSEDK